MNTSVLIPAAETAATTARYTLLLSADPELIDAAQRLRHDVFSAEPGFTLPPAADGRDADEFDQHCDHLLVREDTTGRFVGCYRMLPPPGAIAAGGLYTATEFDISGWDRLRPSLVEMGRAVVRPEHRNGAVVLLMWTGILAYLDRSGYDYVAGCVSVPVGGVGAPGAQIRSVHDFVSRRHAVAPEHRVTPHRPVVLDGRGLADLPALDREGRTALPPLMRGYLRLGTEVCGAPAHDPGFGVADFPALLDKRRADIRYLNRLRSAGAAVAAEATR